jgi:hypothetical protein
LAGTHSAKPSFSRGCFAARISPPDATVLTFPIDGEEDVSRPWRSYLNR